MTSENIENLRNLILTLKQQYMVLGAMEATSDDEAEIATHTQKIRGTESLINLVLNSIPVKE